MLLTLFVVLEHVIELPEQVRVDVSEQLLDEVLTVLSDICLQSLHKFFLLRRVGIEAVLQNFSTVLED